MRNLIIQFSNSIKNFRSILMMLLFIKILSSSLFQLVKRGYYFVYHNRLARKNLIVFVIDDTLLEFKDKFTCVLSFHLLLTLYLKNRIQFSFLMKQAFNIWLEYFTIFTFLNELNPSKNDCKKQLLNSWYAWLWLHFKRCYFIKYINRRQRNGNHSMQVCIFCVLQCFQTLFSLSVQSPNETLSRSCSRAMRIHGSRYALKGDWS